MNNEQSPPTRGFITYPNQAVWKIDKPVSQERLFLQVDAGDADKALTILGKSAIRLWFHLMAHRNGFEFGFSPAAVEKAIGMKRDGCKAARKELIEKGYLEHVSGNRYILHSSPIDKTKCRLPDTGGILHLHSETPPVGCQNYPLWAENDSLTGGKTPPVGWELHPETIKDNKYYKNIIKDNHADELFCFSGYNFFNDTDVSEDNLLLSSHKENIDIQENRSNYSTNSFYIISGRMKKHLFMISPKKNRLYEEYKSKIAAILYRYSGNGKNFRQLLRIGRNGILIDGWDENNLQPIIKLFPCFVPLKEIRQSVDKIEEILRAGYLNEVEEYIAYDIIKERERTAKSHDTELPFQ